jgi:hypothetical protein
MAYVLPLLRDSPASHTPLLQKELNERLRSEMRGNHDQIASLTRPLDPERLVRRPAPDKWSVGEVLEHLVLMDDLFLKPTEKLVRESPWDAAAPLRTFRETFVGKQIAASLEKPKPLKSPKAAVPKTPRAGVVEAFLLGDARFLNLIDEASSLDWNRVRLRPPVAPWVPLRMNLGDVFHVHVVHVRRHLGQIERVLTSA